MMIFSYSFNVYPIGFSSLFSCTVLKIKRTNGIVRGLQRDVVYLCWPIAPPSYESKCGGGGSCGVSNQWVQLCTSRDMEPKYINFEDLPLDLTMVIVFVFGTVYFLKTYSLRKNPCFQYFKQIGFGRAARPTFSKQDLPPPRPSQYRCSTGSEGCLSLWLLVMYVYLSVS